MHTLRESFMKKEKESDTEYSAMQAAIMEENKNFREQVQSLEESLELALKNVKNETERNVALEANIHRLKTELATARDSIDLLKSEIKSFEFKLKNQKEEILALSRNQVLGRNLMYLFVVFKAQ